MTSRPPPIPPENRPKAGPSGEQGNRHQARVHDKQEQADNPDKRGQSANTRINTTHQGYQQDR